MTRTDHHRAATAHTPEPWFYNRDEGGCQGHNVNTVEYIICDLSDAGDGAAPVTEANARRIVAAVNACEGTPTEALERGVVRELLEALVSLILYAESEAEYLDAVADSKNTELAAGKAWQAIAEAKAAIAKATGRAA